MNKTNVSDYSSLAEFFFEGGVRIERIIWIAGCSDQAPEAFQDFIDDHSEDELEKLLGVKIARPVDEDDDSELDADELLCDLARAGKHGILVQAATPVPQSFAPDGHSFMSYGFGHCYMKWFYTDALDAAFAQRLADWKDEMIEKTRRELARKPKGKKAAAA